MIVDRGENRFAVRGDRGRVEMETSHVFDCCVTHTFMCGDSCHGGRITLIGFGVKDDKEGYNKQHRIYKYVCRRVYTTVTKIGNMKIKYRDARRWCSNLTRIFQRRQS